MFWTKCTFSSWSCKAARATNSVTPAYAIWTWVSDTHMLMHAHTLTQIHDYTHLKLRYVLDYQIAVRLHPVLALHTSGAERTIPTSSSSSSSHDPGPALLSVLCFHANRPSHVKYPSCSAAKVRCLLLASCEDEPVLVCFFMTADCCSTQWGSWKSIIIC